MSSQTVKMNSGHTMPVIGLGTWQSNPGEVAAAVKVAINSGYRHIDCAHLYMNEQEIGTALKEVFAEGKVKREDLFIVSKVWNTHHSYAEATENINTILSDLQLPYLDLLLMHFPHGFKEGTGEMFPLGKDGKVEFSNVDYLETWKALEDAQKAGKAKSIGISNFNHKQIQRLWDSARIKPACLQVELHPFLNQAKLRQFCRDKGMVVVGYSPLGNPGSTWGRKEGDPNVLTSEIITNIAKSHGKSPAQIVLRWFIESGLVAIPKSVTPHRIAENFDLFNFKLTTDEVKQIDTLNRGWRLVGIEEQNHSPHFPFHEEF